METLYGIHPVIECIRAGRRHITAIHVAQGKANKKLEAVMHLAEDHKIPLKISCISRIQSMVKSHEHQGVCAITSPFPVTNIFDIINEFQPGNKAFLLLLDNIVDPHNLGALVRTAVCVGIHGIIITKDRSALPTPAVSKASAGALEHAFLSRVTNMTATIKELKKKGVWVAGMDKGATTSIYATDFTGYMAIVIGGEEKGIRPLVMKHCDVLAHIPQLEPMNSLNASVAGAVAMYEAFRQRLSVP